jgi:hypothetical protein
LFAADIFARASGENGGNLRPFDAFDALETLARSSGSAILRLIATAIFARVSAECR